MPCVCTTIYKWEQALPLHYLNCTCLYKKHKFHTSQKTFHYNTEEVILPDKHQWHILPFLELLLYNAVDNAAHAIHPRTLQSYTQELLKWESSPQSGVRYHWKVYSSHIGYGVFFHAKWYNLTTFETIKIKELTFSWTQNTFQHKMGMTN